MPREHRACAVTTTPTGTSQATHHTNAVFGTTLICEGNPLVEAVASVWGCGSEAERMMSVIQLSAILLHELCHLAWYVGDGTDRTGCRRVEAVELTFIWACLQRYPDALNAPCASPFTSLGLDALFLNGENGVANNIVMDLSSCTTNCGGAREAQVTAGSRTAAAEWLIGDRTFAAPSITSAAPPPDRASPP
jgi:hypothetical protein